MARCECPVTDEERVEKRIRVRKQFEQAKGPTQVTCGCGRTNPIRFMYRCLYCGEFYCQPCAEEHFGKTREQYNAEHPHEMRAEA